ncbi:MAG: 4'-phosphopantetheinyl transferase superfamily protein [Desulfuromonadaceae bacterium]|nr:4'-phosphopantetheinyl transferase superfamily protein [Desulfuromonadaceae bacterium]
MFPWPQDNEVQIHCRHLAANTAYYVSSDEMSRADRLLAPDKKNSFIAGRGLLREILSGYLGIKAEKLHFTVGEHGKPRLLGNKADNGRLHFNLSHSGDLFLLAVGIDREVGIDVEQIRNDTPFRDIARLAFSPDEQQRLLALPDDLQRDAFFRCWTRKEACLKACGMGFALTVNRFEINFFQETPTVFVSPDDLSIWTLEDITAPVDHCAALAVKGAAPIIRYV